MQTAWTKISSITLAGKNIEFIYFLYQSISNLSIWISAKSCIKNFDLALNDFCLLEPTIQPKL